MRKAVGNARDTNVGKLASNLEGLYRITVIVGARAYYMKDGGETTPPAMECSKFMKVLSLTLGGNCKLYTIVV